MSNRSTEKAKRYEVEGFRIVFGGWRGRVVACEARDSLEPQFIEKDHLRRLKGSSRSLRGEQSEPPPGEATARAVLQTVFIRRRCNACGVESAANVDLRVVACGARAV